MRTSLTSFFVAVILLIASGSSFAQSRAERRAARLTIPTTEEKKVTHDTGDTSERDMWVYGDETSGDTLWKKRVWREIDLREAQNKVMAFDTTIARDSNLIMIMVQGVLSGKYKAFSGANDSLIQALSENDLMSIIAPGSTHPLADLRAKDVVKYKIKEDWMFIRSAGEMQVHIVGIAPMTETKSADGPANKVLFWLPYPDIRADLSTHRVMNFASKMSWYDYFESRQFSSKIVKVSNPFDGGKKISH